MKVTTTLKAVAQAPQVRPQQSPQQTTTTQPMKNRSKKPALHHHIPTSSPTTHTASTRVKRNATTMLDEGPPLFAASFDGLEYITIHRNGRTLLRHRKADGLVDTYVQDLPLLANVIHELNCPDRWRAAIFELPPELRPHFNPASVIMLRRQRLDGRWDFLIPRAPCTPAQADALIETFIDALTICNAGSVSAIIRTDDQTPGQQDL